MVKKSDLMRATANSVLVCCCGDEYSSTIGDYWILEEDDEIRCNCGDELILVNKIVKYEEV